LGEFKASHEAGKGWPDDIKAKFGTPRVKEGEEEVAEEKPKKAAKKKLAAKKPARAKKPKPAELPPI
jgi:hypothetical protein